MPKPFKPTNKHSDLLKWMIDNCEIYQGATVLYDDNDEGADKWRDFVASCATDDVKVPVKEFRQFVEHHDSNDIGKGFNITEKFRDAFYCLRAKEHSQIYREYRASKSPSGSPNLKVILERRFKKEWSERYVNREIDFELLNNKEIDEKQVSVIFKAPE